MTTATDIQTAIESTLDSVAGLTVTDRAVTGNVAAKDMPATVAVFDGYDDVNVSTETAERVGSWSVPVFLAMADPAAFKTAMLSVIPAIYRAFERDWTGDGLVSVTDGGEPEIVSDAGAAVIARKLLYVKVTFEEPLDAA